MEQKTKEKFSERKAIVGSFAVISLVSGVSLFNQKLSGNVILSKTTNALNPLSLLGSALIVCSIIFFAYLFKRK